MIKNILVFIFLSGPFTLLAQCKDSTRVDLYHHCDLPYQPVCGCDNVTYRNECAAENWGGIIYSGFSQPWTEGICHNVSFDFDFVPNPVSAFSNSGVDSHLHIYFNKSLLPVRYSVYILDIFNKLMFQWDDVAVSNNESSGGDRGTPVKGLTTDYFSRFEKGVYILIISANGEQKAKKIMKINLQ